MAQLPPHYHGRGTLSTRAAGHHAHGISDPGHNHGGNTGIAWYGRGTFAFSGRGGAANDFGRHTHSINKDFTRITVRQAGNHAHHMEGTTASEGQGKPFSIMPPYHLINYIIYAGPKTQT